MVSGPIGNPAAFLRSRVERSYSALPSGLQDLACSLYGLQERVRRQGTLAHLKKRVRAIDALHFDEGERQWVRESRLSEILHAAERLPGYRQLDKHLSSETPLEQWPILTKEMLRSDGELFVSRSPGRRDIKTTTSGTTGTPITVWRTRETLRELFACVAAWRSWYGVRLFPRRASFTGKLVVPVESERVWRLNLPGRQLVLSQYHLAPHTVERYARALKLWHPEVLDGYTSNLVDLARFLRDRENSVGVPKIPLTVTTCEILADEGRALLEEVFGGRVGDQYGSSEHVAFAGECPHGRRHIFENVGLIEVVDQDGQRVSSGTPGRLLLTTLVNDLMPLVRYDIGDIGAVDDSSGSCPCGRTSPVLQSIQGRADDTIVTPDGRSVAIFAFNLLRGTSGVVQIQLVQEGVRDFAVRVVLASDDADIKRSFADHIRSRFAELLGDDPGRRVSFSYEKTIERDPGGKIRNVVRRF